MFVRSIAGGQRRRSRVSFDNSIRSRDDDKNRTLRRKQSVFSKPQNDQALSFSLQDSLRRNIAQFDHILFHDINLENQLIINKIRSTRRRRILKRINIRVQGHLFQTHEKTINSFPSTLLGKRWLREKYYDKEKSEYVFNRCALSFDAILFYYQSGGILSRPANVTRDQFTEELKFFQIKECFDMRHRTELAFEEKTRRAKIPPPSKLKKYIWKNVCFRNDPNTRNCSYFFYIVGNIMLSAFGICLEPSLPSRQVWIAIESFLFSFYSLEFLIQIYVARNRKEYILSPFGLMDFFSMVSSGCYLIVYLYEPGTELKTFSKYFRLVRLFKSTKVSHGMQQFMHVFYDCREFLLSFILTVAIACLVCSSVVKLAEETLIENSEKVELMNWAWYSFITASGVGYGDIYPKSIAGKLCGASMSIVGVLLFCLPASHIIGKFVECYYLPDIVGECIDVKKKKLISYTRATFFGDMK